MAMRLPASECTLSVLHGMHDTHISCLKALLECNTMLWPDVFLPVLDVASKCAQGRMSDE